MCTSHDSNVSECTVGCFDAEKNSFIISYVYVANFSTFRSTQQHTLDSPPNTLTAITISRPNSQCMELASLSDLDRRPDGAEQTDASERGEFYGSRHSNPIVDKERQRTSGCSTDYNSATTFGREKIASTPQNTSSKEGDSRSRISGTSSTGVSRTSRSSVSGSSITASAAAVAEVKIPFQLS